MASPQAYGLQPGGVERIETHASIVFLAGDRAYKIKRAVKYPFLDFSSLAKRHWACLNELAVNRRTAPKLYLGVVPIVEVSGGGFRIGGEGKVVEWALMMRRFDQSKLYDRMAEEGRLAIEAMRPLARVVAAFHQTADRVLTASESVHRLAGVLADNGSALAGSAGVLPEAGAAAYAVTSRAALTELSPLLEERAMSGYVRHCHGDLHLRNIVEIDGAPVLFDAIEFDDALATIDILYDLAFLLMDLGARDLKAHANEVLNAYLDADGGTGNLVGLRALPLFLSTRAAIRAKVELLRAMHSSGAVQAQAQDNARKYFSLAKDYLALRRPLLVAIGGLSGSGKSSVARALAPQLGRFPGAVQVRSDVERKRLFGVDPDRRLPERAYAPEISDIVYAAAHKRAELTLACGQSVILDAVQARPEEREAVAKLAEAAGADFVGLWLDAPGEVLRGRVQAREGDVSDATPDVVEAQLAYEIGRQSFATVDAGRPLDEVVRSCLATIRAGARG
jgi:hypothetical protein